MRYVRPHSMQPKQCSASHPPVVVQVDAVDRRDFALSAQAMTQRSTGKGGGGTVRQAGGSDWSLKLYAPICASPITGVTIRA